MLEEKKRMKPSKKKKSTPLVRDADDLIHIRQLKPQAMLGVEDDDVRCNIRFFMFRILFYFYFFISDW